MAVTSHVSQQRLRAGDARHKNAVGAREILGQNKHSVEDRIGSEELKRDDGLRIRTFAQSFGPSVREEIAVSSWKTLAFAAIAAGALFWEATPAVASTEYLCVAGAYRANGAFVSGTRSETSRYSRRRACSAALAACRRKLNDVRYYTRRPMPFAGCEVIDVLSITEGPSRYRDDDDYDSYGDDSYRGDDDDDYGYRGGHNRDRYCNYAACDARYRSFRASDCSYQPYRGRRRRCTL